MTQPLRLHTTSTAPNPRRVHLFLAEKGIEIETVEIDIGKQEHKTPEYLAMAGMPHVPVLEFEDGSAISESVAICRYFEALHPDPPLFGETPRQMAEIEMRHRRVELYLMAPIAMVFRHTHPSMATLENQVPDWAEVNRPRVIGGLKHMNAVLADRPYLAGESVSVADLTAIVALKFFRVLRMDPPNLPHLTAYMGRMEARPAVQSVLGRPK